MPKNILKNILKSIPVLCLVLLLTNGCSEEATEAPKAPEAAKVSAITEIVNTSRRVNKERCKLDLPEEPLACTMQFDPVCGCDYKTYGNACMARAAGVPRSAPGACEENANH